MDRIALEGVSKQAGTSPGSHRTAGPQVHQAHGGMPVPPHHPGTLDTEDTGTGK